MGKTTSVDTALYGLVSLIFGVFHWIADTILTMVVAASVLLFVLQFSHSPKLLHWSWISEIQRAGGPVLAEISSWVRMD